MPDGNSNAGKSAPPRDGGGPEPGRPRLPGADDPSDGLSALSRPRRRRIRPDTRKLPDPGPPGPPDDDALDVNRIIQMFRKCVKGQFT